MSDTPRTYAARMPYNSHNYKHDVVHIDTCIELERENAALRADKERLEWLMSGHVISTVFTFNRTAIDAARKENKQ